ncbi:hypothetical protein WJX73_005072 [Symbiochloris irregularis]|uniref:BZIP domain-containing protein n=1 Tax=Symbiochloris irregularis TaxID=706552 RepID=A0AAW1P2P9_9CHLO
MSSSASDVMPADTGSGRRGNSQSTLPSRASWEPKPELRSLLSRLSGSSIAQLDLQAFLGEGPDFLLPLDVEQDMLAFMVQTDALEAGYDMPQVLPSAFMSRASSQALSSSRSGLEQHRAMANLNQKDSNGTQGTNSSGIVMGGQIRPASAPTPSMTAVLDSQADAITAAAAEAAYAEAAAYATDDGGVKRRKSARNLKPSFSKSSMAESVNMEDQFAGLSEKEFKRMRRRMTNRESAQRMRKKRQEDFDTMVIKLTEAETENDRLVQMHAAMSAVVQRMRREVVTWQVRCQGRERQNSALLQSIITKEGPALANAAARIMLENATEYTGELADNPTPTQLDTNPTATTATPAESIQDTMCAFPLPPPPTQMASPSPFPDAMVLENDQKEDPDLYMMMTEQLPDPLDEIESGANGVMSPMAMFAASRSLLKDNSNDGGSGVGFLNDTPGQTPRSQAKDDSMSHLEDVGVKIKVEEEGRKGHASSPLSVNIHVGMPRDSEERTFHNKETNYIVKDLFDAMELKHAVSRRRRLFKRSDLTFPFTMSMSGKW